MKNSPKLFVALLFTTLTSIAMAADMSMLRDQSIAQSINQFGFDIYHDLRLQEENVTFSPTSISLALGMLYAGAQKDTAKAMQKELYFAENSMDFHQSLGAFSQSLLRDAETGTTVAIANDVWIQENFDLLDAFVDVMSAGYGAKPQQLDFKNNAKKSTAIINAAINEKTKTQIPSLFKSDLDKTTRLVLTNAIYFDARWETRFKTFFTDDGEFLTRNGSMMPVKYMNQTSHYLYSDDDTKQVLAMPYKHDEFFALFVLPHEGQADAVEKAMTLSTFSAMLSSLEDTNVDVKLPKFIQRMSPKMKDVLEARGLGILFDEKRADLSGINGVTDGDDKLQVGVMSHEAVVKMNEGGTTAAAASGIGVVGTTSVLPEREPAVDFHATRSFLFFIVHKASNAIMFMGRVAEPVSVQ